MTLNPQEITSFQDKILSWYQNNKRDLPWRQTRDPYAIFISEVMSQQTQISRVIPKYQLWLERFPTVEYLAKASVAEVLAMWSGLGYNRRALNMKKAAELITNEFAGIFPKEEKELLALPGIGHYTARAIMCFAFDQQIAVVDTNVRKVILTQFIKESHVLRTPPLVKGDRGIKEKEIEDIANKLLPVGRASEWNQALMDYAAAVLKKEKIPIPKQSKFIGSHRYYRGQILKSLLKQHEIAINDLGNLIKKDYSLSEEAWVKSLISELKEEGFIVVKNEKISLAS